MPSALRMSRARMYVLLDAFEQDMREAIEKYITDHLSEEQAFGSDFERANILRINDVGDGSVSIVHYLFLRQAFDALARHRELLPGELASEIKANTGRLDAIVPIRNRVMHGRPLRDGDPESVASGVRAFTTRHWKNSHEILARLESDPEWEPYFEAVPAPSERVLHNLPLADYDETGLIGRSVDVARLKTMLQKRREPIVTITGEGGIGKTALALEVAYSIVDDRESVFDCILWVSLKSEMLTANGVRSIADAVKGISGATNEIGAVLDKDFAGSVHELADMLSGITALVIIDNLESAQGDEVLRLYDTLPDSVTYLFTSRVGIGQIERRVPLGPLAIGDSTLLLKKLASTRNLLQLTRLSSLATRQVSERLRNSPLAIKWYVLSVAAGRDPLTTVRNQDELINYCISNVFDALSPRARSVLFVMDALSRSIAFDELAIFCDLSIDELRAASQELSRGAMLVHEPDVDGGLYSRLGLSVAAQMFLKKRPDRESAVARVMTAEQDYRKSVEKSRVEEASRRLGPNIVRARAPEDEPVVHLLRLALSHSRRGDLEKSDELVARARSLNPEYWEIDRVAGFIASSHGRAVEASVFYRSALENVQTDEERAITSYYLAGNLARRMHDVESAIEHARFAHEVLQSEETALQLGNFLVWVRQFEEGQALILQASEVAQGKTYMIAMTAYVESWRRWSEAVLDEHQPVDAIDKAFLGFESGVAALASGYVDTRLASEVLEAATAIVRAMTVQGSMVDNERLNAVLVWMRANMGLVKAGGIGSFAKHLSVALRDESCDVENSELGRFIIGPVQAGAEGMATLVGEVLSWRGRFGFIKHSDYPDNVFFHRGSVEDESASHLAAGLAVEFSVSYEGDGRPRANSVRLLVSRNRHVRAVTSAP